MAFDGNRFGDRVIRSSVSGTYISGFIDEALYPFLDDLRNYANRSSLFRTAFSIGAVAWIRVEWGYYCSLAQGRISVAPTEELAVRDLLPKKTSDVISHQAYITDIRFTSTRVLGRSNAFLLFYSRRLTDSELENTYTISRLQALCGITCTTCFDASSQKGRFVRDVFKRIYNRETRR